jgi:hypothetical protein
MRIGCLSIDWLNTSYRVSYIMAAVSLLLVVVLLAVELRNRSVSWPAIYIPLLVLQPGWRLAWGELMRHGMREASSDCGFANRAESIFLTATLFAIVIIVFMKGANKRSFLFYWTAICWSICVVVAILGYSSLPFAFLSSVASSDLAGQILGTMDGAGARLGGYAIILTGICIGLFVTKHVRRRSVSDS